MSMIKDEFKEELTSILESKDSFDKYVIVNTKLNNIGGGLAGIGLFMVGYNVISTIFGIIEGAGISYIPYYFWSFLFDRSSGENFVMYLLMMAGLVFLVIGGILLAIYYVKKNDILSKEFTDFYETKSLTVLPLYQVNKGYAIEVHDIEVMEKVDEFLETSTKEAQKLRKVFNVANPNNGPKPIEKAILKQAGITLVVKQLVPLNSANVILLEDDPYQCFFTDKNGKKQGIKIKKMQNDGVLKNRY